MVNSKKEKRREHREREKENNSQSIIGYTSMVVTFESIKNVKHFYRVNCFLSHYVGLFCCLRCQPINNWLWHIINAPMVICTWSSTNEKRKFKYNNKKKKRQKNSKHYDGSQFTAMAFCSVLKRWKCVYTLFIMYPNAFNKLIRLTSHRCCRYCRYQLFWST